MNPPALPLLPEDAAPDAPLLVAFSGGLDSSVLLHLLAGSAQANTRGLRALHVHHGLQADADAWAAHCQAVCDGLGVALRIMRVRVDQPSPLGPEGAARAARHAAFAAELRAGEVLALAHHRDDQAETFLLRALRASGPDGLSAMRAWRAYGEGWLWRPLLDTPRDALHAYAQAHGLRWLEDPSNADTALDRNFLRQQVMPLLRTRWPGVHASFARAAELQADAATLLQGDDARALASVRTADPAVIRADALQAWPTARRARVLRMWIDTLDLPPLPAQAIARVETELLGARADAQAAFGWSGAVVRYWRGLLHAGVRRAPLSADWSAQWTLDERLSLPGGGTLAIEGDPLTERDGEFASPPLPLRVHARRGGERITLPGRTHTHALKHVLQDLGVPPWERAALPLVSDAQGTLLAAGDLVYSASFDAWLRARGARLAWSPV